METASRLEVTESLSDKIFVGNRASDMDTGDIFQVTKVNLNVDSENYYTAGDDTGQTIEVTCPWGSQEMANSILASLQGYQYRPYTATDALLDPAAEIGDAVTVGGVYSVIANVDTVFDRACAPSISAPDSDEIDDEYPYESRERKETNRQLAQTRSLISKTSEEIQMLVESEINDLSASITVELQAITQRIDGLDGQYTEVSTTLDGLTVTDSTGKTVINGSMIQTSNLYVSAANITGSLTIGQLPDSVAQTSDIPQYTSELINNSGYQTASGVTSIVNGTVTTDYINALGLTVNSIKLGGNMTVYQSVYSNVAGGYIGYTTSTLGLSPGIHMQMGSGEVACTSSGARMMYGSTSNQIYISSGAAGITTGGNGYVFNSARFVPGNDGQTGLGMSSARWSQLFAATSVISTSDENLKHDIETLPDKYVTMLDNVTPKRFKLNDGTSDRYHPGFTAQDVKSAMDISDITPTEFGGWCLDVGASGEEIQMLRYEEFIAPMLLKIKKLESRIAELEAK